MLKFIQEWFAARDPYDTFSPKERAIYYFSSTGGRAKSRSASVFEAVRGRSRHARQLASNGESPMLDEATTHKARAEAVEKICNIFEVRR